MIIFVPEELSVLTIQEEELPKNWRKGFCSTCLQLGKLWYEEIKRPILKVPTSIIPNEWNFLLNTRHPDFSQVKLVNTEGFLFDQRLS